MFSSAIVRKFPVLNTDQTYKRSNQTLATLLKAAAVVCLLAVSRPAIAAYGFSEPTAVNNLSQTVPRPDMFPSAATDGHGNWIVVWHAFQNLFGNGEDGDLFVSRSSSDAVNWSSTALLSPRATTDSGSDLQPVVATNGQGIWISMWQSSDDLGGEKGTDWDILFSRSEDNGVTWGTERPLYPSATLDAGEDDRPRLQYIGGTHWMVVWVSTEQPGHVIGDYEIRFSHSLDNGLNWDEPQNLNTTALGNDGDDILPDIAIDGQGNVVCVWGSKSIPGGGASVTYEMVSARSQDNGYTWSDPQYVNPGMVDRPGDDGIVNLTGGYHGPNIATDRQGTWIATWSSFKVLDDTPLEIGHAFWARSIDHGQTWSAVDTFNTYNRSIVGDTFPRTQEEPQVSVDSAGRWFAVWSTQYFSGPGSLDFDIAISKSSDQGRTWEAGLPLNQTAVLDECGNDRRPFLFHSPGTYLCLYHSTIPTFRVIGPGEFFNLRALSVLSQNIDEVIPTGELVRDYLLGLLVLDANRDKRIDSADLITINQKPTNPNLN